VTRAHEPIGAPERTFDRSGERGVVRLELPATAPYHAVGRLVVGGVASRLSFEVEQIEDLQLAVEALLSRRTAKERVRIELTESVLGLQARLGPFAPVPDERERVRRMLRALVEDADVQDSREGEWIVLKATRCRAPEARSS
jgi:hypothetical protein